LPIFEDPLVKPLSESDVHIYDQLLFQLLLIEIQTKIRGN